MENDSILFTFQRVVEGGNVDNLITMIIQSLIQQGGLTQEKTTNLEADLFWCRWGLPFPRLPHWSDISIEEEICSLHDGTTLHGPKDESCCSSFVKFIHGGQVGRFITIITFLFIQLP
jgi:hypothetical protein